MGFMQEIAARLVATGAATGATVIAGPKATIVGTGPWIQLNETGGSGPARTQNSVATPAYVRPSMQILITASGWETARAKAQACYNALVGVRNTTLSGTWYMEINPDQEPFDWPLDTAGRPRVGFNISTYKRPS